jgi:predicted nucleotidyltransferase
MDVGQPSADVIPGARGAVLATLVQLEIPVTVRDLARHAGVSPQGALSLVNDLARAGLVHVEAAGRSLMVSLNRDHLAAEPLIGLMSLRAGLVDRLAAELAEWEDLAGAWLFGSAARGDGDSDSDIDLFLVAGRSIDNDRWERQTATLIDRVRAWTGNPVQIVEHTRRTFAALAGEGNPLVAVLRNEGIPLTPRSRQLLRKAA